MLPAFRWSFADVARMTLKVDQAWSNRVRVFGQSSTNMLAVPNVNSAFFFASSAVAICE
jgi:hypothetical protein